VKGEGEDFDETEVLATGANDEALEHRLQALRRRHRDLDKAILALENERNPDVLTIKRFKKEKLRLRDEMAVVYAQMNPDIIA
jgi:hypothetical protein